MPILLHILHDKGIHKFNLKKEGTVTIGRKGGNDIKLEDKTSSGRHARIVIRDHHNQFMKLIKEVVVEDLGSTNGTYLNGKKIKANLLKHGDAIKFCDHSFRYEDD